MNLNGMICSEYNEIGNRFFATLLNTSISDISKLDGSMLCLETDDGTKTYYGGYSITGIELAENNAFTVRFIKSMNDQTRSAIDAVNANYEFMNNSIAELSNNTRSMAIAMQYSMRDAAKYIKDSEAVNVLNYISTWKAGQKYEKGQFLTYSDRYFRVSQDHTSQDTWHPGDAGTEALYYEIVIASDGIIVWKQPNGEYDAPDKGDLRHYPDADSPVYISKVDGNAYDPVTYPANWELYSENE